MKKGILLLFIFIRSISFGQNSQLPVVELIKSTKDTIAALEIGNDSTRLIKIKVRVKAFEPIKAYFPIEIVDYDNIESKPTLIDGMGIIEKEFPWNHLNADSIFTTEAICIIKLNGVCIKGEKFYLIQKGDYKNVITTYIKPTEIKINTPAKPELISHLHLDSSTTYLNPIYAKDSIRYEKVIVKLIRDVAPTVTDTDRVTYNLNNFRLPASMSIKSNSTVIFSLANHHLDSTTKKGIYTYYDTLIVFNSSVKDSLNRDMAGFININKDSKKGFHEINFTEKGMYKDQPFWMETGANFDLLDGIRANNLFAGIFMFKKDIATINKQRKMSFTGGVYESKSSSLSASSDSGFIYRDGTSYLQQNNGYRYYRDTGSIKTSTQVQNVGIFFSPHFRISNLSSYSYGYHIYISLYAEMLWQRVNSSFDYSKTGRDSVMYESTLNNIYKYNYKEYNSSSDFRTQYLGIGFPIYITDPSFSLYINDVFGYCNQRFSAIQDADPTKLSAFKQLPPEQLKNLSTNTYLQPNHAWNPFYILQFRLTEETYGFVFSGEVRGFMLKNSKPVISLALTKKFNLGELLKTIAKPFTPGL